MNIAVVLAGGMGKRFESIVHKQYLKLNGKEIVAYPVERLRRSSQIDKVLLVVDKDEFETRFIEKKYDVECICGGKTRNQSIKNALDYIHERYNCDKILFQDATRPLVQAEFFDFCMKQFFDCDCVISYQKITDSLCDEKNSFLNRDTFKLIQTPEIFNFNQIYDAFDENSSNTTIVSQLRNPKIKFVKANYFSFKITYPSDLFLAEQLDQIDYVQIKKEKDAKLKDKNVLVFGGSGGLGRKLIEKLKSFENVKVLSPSSKEINLRDVSVEELEKLCQNFKPDILINTAAVSHNDGDGIIETFDEDFAVNLKSNLVMLEFLKKQKMPAKFLTISSSSSTRGRKNITNYSASKSALNSVIESLAEEYYNIGILINAVVPEKINTQMIQKLHKSNIQSRELLSTEEVVNAIVEILAQDNLYGKLVHIRKGM